MTHDEAHHLRRKRGYAGKGSKAAPQPRVPTMGEVDRDRARETADATDTPDDSPKFCEKRSRADDLRLAPDSGK